VYTENGPSPQKIMSNRRIVRVNELLKREIAGALYRILNERGFDLSAVTVVRVQTSSDLRHAEVFVSILGHRHERGSMLRLIRSHRADFQRDIHRNLRLKYIPRLTFSLDDSIEKGDRVLAIINQMEQHGQSEDHSQNE